MSQETVNPYEILATQYSAGLNAIIASLAAGVTIDNIVTAVYNYVQPIYYPFGGTGTVPLQVQTEIQSIAYHAINSYVNSLVPQGSAMFMPSQYPFIDMLIGPSVTKNLPIYLTNWISDVEDNITKASLTVDEQRPILMATAIGNAAYTYWRAETLAGSSSAWAAYFVSNNNDYNSIPFWVEGSINGSFSGYGANYQGLVEPTTDKYSTTMIASLIGALTIATAKVILGLIPRITKKLSLNSQTVASFNQLGGTMVFQGGAVGLVGASTTTPCTIQGSYLISCYGGVCPQTSTNAPGVAPNCLACTMDSCVTCNSCAANCSVTCGQFCQTNMGTSCNGTCAGLVCQTNNEAICKVASVNGVVCATPQCPPVTVQATCAGTCAASCAGASCNMNTCNALVSCNVANCSC